MKGLTGASAWPLGAMERVWLVAGRLAPPFVIRFVVELDHLPDPNTLQAAWSTTIAAIPLLRARLRGVLGWTQWVPDGPHPPLGTLPTDHLRGLDPDGPGCDPQIFGDLGLDPYKGPVAALQTCPGGTPRLILTILHTICDGRGGLAILDHLFAHLRGESPDPPPPPLPDTHFLAPTGPIPPPPAQTADCPYPPVSAGDAGIRARSSGLPSTGWLVRRRLPTAPADALGQLLAAFRQPGRHLQVDVPVDLRPAGTARPGNATGILQLDLDQLPAEPTAIRAHIRTLVGARAHEGVVRGTAPARRLPLALLHHWGRSKASSERKTGKLRHSATLTNLGRIDLARVSTPTSRASALWLAPPHAPGLPLLLTMASGEQAGGGTLDLCGAFPTTWADPATAVAFFDGPSGYLLRVGSGPAGPDRSGGPATRS